MTFQIYAPLWTAPCGCHSNTFTRQSFTLRRLDPVRVRRYVALRGPASSTTQLFLQEDTRIAQLQHWSSGCVGTELTKGWSTDKKGCLLHMKMEVADNVTSEPSLV